MLRFAVRVAVIAALSCLSGLSALGEDTPAPGEDTPAPGEDTPAPGEDTPAPGEDTPALGEDTPAMLVTSDSGRLKFVNVDKTLKANSRIGIVAYPEMAIAFVSVFNQRIPNLKIGKYPSPVILHCTFTMY